MNQDLQTILEKLIEKQSTFQELVGETKDSASAAAALREMQELQHRMVLVQGLLGSQTEKFKISAEARLSVRNAGANLDRAFGRTDPFRDILQAHAEWLSAIDTVIDSAKIYGLEGDTGTDAK